MSTIPSTPGPVNNPLALAALAVINQTKRGTPELQELVNQVRLALHAAGQLETAAEAAFHDANNVFAGFHGAVPLTPLPQPPAAVPDPAWQPPALPPSTGDTATAPVAEAAPAAPVTAAAPEPEAAIDSVPEPHQNPLEAPATSPLQELVEIAQVIVAAPTTITVTDDGPPAASPVPDLG